MLKKVNKISVGVDKNTNPEIILHEHMMALFNMKQGQMEADDDYLKRLKSRLHNMEMDGGKICYADPN